MAARVPLAASRICAPTLACRARGMAVLVSPKMVEQVVLSAADTPHMNALKMGCDGAQPVL